MPQGKTHAGSWGENPPQIMRLLTKTQHRKHSTENTPKNKDFGEIAIWFNHQ
jgi:hypothetical protein